MDGNSHLGSGEAIRLSEAAIDGDRFAVAFESAGVTPSPVGNRIDQGEPAAPRRPVELDVERIDWSRDSSWAAIVPRFAAPGQEVELLLLEGPEGAHIDGNGRVVVRRPEYDRPHVVLALVHRGIALAYETVIFEIVNRQSR